MGWWATELCSRTCGGWPGPWPLHTRYWWGPPLKERKPMVLPRSRGSARYALQIFSAGPGVKERCSCLCTCQGHPIEAAVASGCDVTLHFHSSARSQTLVTFEWCTGDFRCQLGGSGVSTAHPASDFHGVQQGCISALERCGAPSSPAAPQGVPYLSCTWFSSSSQPGMMSGCIILLSGGSNVGGSLTVVLEAARLGTLNPHEGGIPKPSKP